jgi:hypothetical protein
VYMQQRNAQPDTNSQSWLDWCYVYDRACKGLHEPIKRRVDAGKFDYNDFVAIWKATKKERENAGKVCKTG